MPSEPEYHPVVTAVIPISEPSSELGLLKAWVKDLDARMFLILIVDKSKRDSVEFVKSFKENDRSIRVIEIEPLDPGSAREIGRKHCNTEYIAFWDCDDLPHVDQIILEVSRIKSSTDVLVGNFEKYDIRTEEVHTKSRRAPTFFSVLYTPGIWRMVFKTSSISEIHFPPLRMAEDHVFLAQIFVSELKIECTRSILYRYTIGRTHQLSRNQSALFEIPLALDKLKLMLLEGSLSWRSRRNLYFVYFNLMFSHTKRQGNLSNVIYSFRDLKVRGVGEIALVFNAVLCVLLMKVANR